MAFSELMYLLSAIGWIPGCIGLYFIWKQLHISIKQTDAMNQQNKIQKDNVERDKALEMTEYFMDLLDNELTIVLNIFSACGIDKLYKSIRYNEMIHFEKKEAERLLHKDVAEIKEIYDKDINVSYKKIADTYLITENIEEDEIKKMLFFNSLDWNIKNLNEPIDKDGNKMPSDQFDDFKSELGFEMTLYKRKLFSYYIDNRSKLLNKLEYFSMYFSSKLADEQMVYQSLHQVFLSIVQELYGVIVFKNDIDSKDKYYTNIIWLYNLWAKRDAELNMKCIEQNQNLQVKPRYQD